MVNKLLRTEVTAYDVGTALEEHCAGWAEEDLNMVLRLAQEFAEIEGYALVISLDTSWRTRKARMLHYCYVAYQLGDHLDLPVDFVRSDEDRERDCLDRHVLYPLDSE